MNIDKIIEDSKKVGTRADAVSREFEEAMKSGDEERQSQARKALDASATEISESLNKLTKKGGR